MGSHAINGRAHRTGSNDCYMRGPVTLTATVLERLTALRGVAQVAMGSSDNMGPMPFYDTLPVGTMTISAMAGEVLLSTLMISWTLVQDANGTGDVQIFDGMNAPTSSWALHQWAQRAGPIVRAIDMPGSTIDPRWWDTSMTGFRVGDHWLGTALIHPSGIDFAIENNVNSSAATVPTQIGSLSVTPPLTGATEALLILHIGGLRVEATDAVVSIDVENAPAIESRMDATPRAPFTLATIATVAPADTVSAKWHSTSGTVYGDDSHNLIVLRLE